MVKRIKALADHFELSPTAFADRIGVARPVISHIFSERNKPSLEVIQKIGIAFPTISFEWLLYGKGEMLKGIGKIAENILERNGTNSDEKVKQTPIEVAPNVSLNTISESLLSEKSGQRKTSKKIIKVLFFYQDNTFEEFNSSILN